MVWVLNQPGTTSTLQDRLNAQLGTPVEIAADGEILLEPVFRENGEPFFGPYDRSPLSGLHFEAAEDTAAS